MNEGVNSIFAKVTKNYGLQNREIRVDEILRARNVL